MKLFFLSIIFFFNSRIALGWFLVWSFGYCCCLMNALRCGATCTQIRNSITQSQCTSFRSLLESLNNYNYTRKKPTHQYFKTLGTPPTTVNENLFVDICLWPLYCCCHIFYSLVHLNLIVFVGPLQNTRHRMCLRVRLHIIYLSS